MAEILNPRESAGGVVLGPDGRIVVVEQHGNSWTLPKGGVEEGENAMDAARREIFEETGLKNIVLLKELGSYIRNSIGKDGRGENKDWPPSKRTFFLFKTNETALAPQHDPHGEITQARWVTTDEALTILTHPKDAEFLKSIRGTIEG